MTYKVQCEGEYMSLWQSGERETSDVGKARNMAKKFAMQSGAENVSIHAFDRFGNFSHVATF